MANKLSLQHVAGGAAVVFVALSCMSGSVALAEQPTAVPTGTAAAPPGPYPQTSAEAPAPASTRSDVPIVESPKAAGVPAAVAVAVSDVETPTKPPLAVQANGPSTRRRFVVGVSLGFEGRSGDVIVQGDTVGPGFSSSSTVHYTGHQKMPITLDLAGRLSPNVTLGGYVRLAAVLGGETDLSWSLGAEMGVFPAPDASVSPWIGVAVGYQSLGAANPLTGIEIVPQFRIPFRVVRDFTLGPFLNVAFVNYSAASDVCSDCSGWNNWVSVGVRAAWM